MDNDTPSSPTPPRGGTAADSGFFPWLRSLGLTREPGWLGGVSAGIALRLGIDPLIVRGILVVIGILGAPVLFLYAAAWLLLPDTTGRIHLQELFRGIFDRALAGIAILLLLAMLPVGGGTGWWFTGGWWDGDWAGPGLGAIIWTVVLTGAVIWFVVWLANRQSATPSATAMPPADGTAPATTTDAPATTGAPATTTADAPAAATSATLPLVSEPTAPPTPPATAGDAELAAWREGQAEWKREHDNWRAQQSASEKAAREQRQAEARHQRQAEAAERARVAREKELRTRPNTAFTLVAVGLSFVAGAATALILSDTDLAFATLAAASLAVTLAVLGLAIIVNGIRGRRSGGSSGVAILVIIALFFTGVLGWFPRPLISEGTTRWEPSASDRSDSRMLIRGDMVVDMEDYFATGNARIGTVDLFVVNGDVEVIMPGDADGRVEVDSISGRIEVDGDIVDSGGFASSVARYDSTNDRRVIVDVFVIAGDVTVRQAD
ncbi:MULTISPECIES: PspC domain-containing protein [unclassified Salinibacterium]|uniref:PspC domain-containing protein n=1 Tax=unclassified Salinibacterium TaxID=2632331 RepID=UPI00143DB795|nr:MULTISPECIES: PspC domain-containing protein [unclassified Salinibacterium]